MKFFKRPSDPKEKIPRNFIADYTFSQIAFFLAVGTVIPKLTAYYEIPLSLSNLIVGIPSALGFIELLGGYFYNNTNKQMAYIRTTGFIWRMLLPVILLSVLLPQNIGAVCMVLSFLIMSLVQHLSNPAYNAWMVSSTTGIIKSNYYSMRDLVFMPVYTVFMLFSGIVIDYTEKNNNLKFGFEIFGIIVLIFSLISLPYILKALPPPDENAKRIKRSLLKCMLMPLNDKPYLKVLAFHLSWTFFSVLWSNFAGIYQIRVLNLNYFFVTICITVASVLRIVMIPIFSKFADKFSWKTATVVSLGIMFLHCISWIFTTKENADIMFPITTILGTIPWAAFGIGLFKYQIAYTKEENRSVYFSVNSTLSGLIAMLSGIVSSTLVGVLEASSSNPPFWIIFAIGGVGVLLTGFLIIKTPYKEPK